MEINAVHCETGHARVRFGWPRCLFLPLDIGPDGWTDGRTDTRRVEPDQRQRRRATREILETAPTTSSHRNATCTLAARGRACIVRQRQIASRLHYLDGVNPYWRTHALVPTSCYRVVV